MTILIIGASGFIGNSLYQLLKNESVIGTYFNRFKNGLIKLNMTSKSELTSIFNKFKPETVYMPAFIPGVDYCELNKEACNTNKTGVRNIIGMCKKYGSKLVFFSSDYIFDGKCGPYKESEKPNPINEYGKTKLFCENMVQELNNFLIIRTTVVYGYNEESKNFLMSLTTDLTNNLVRKIPIDQRGCPTYVEDLSKIIIKLVKCNKNGIYNVVGPDLCSRYVFALKIARILGFNEGLIKPIKTEKLNQIAKRPLRVGLVIDKIRAEINANPLGIENALNEIKRYFIK